MFDLPSEMVVVLAGDAALTRLLKPIAACELMQKVYKTHPSRRIGLLVWPSDLKAARKRLAETHSRREKTRLHAQKRRQEKEGEYKTKFREEVLRLYPAIPKDDLDGVVELATEVGSGRVGRSQKLSLTDKVELAVRARIRHMYTEYEEKLAELGGDRDARELARELVRGSIEEILGSWQSG
jgi:hypothetical protein